MANFTLPTSYIRTFMLEKVQQQSVKKNVDKYYLF